MKFPWIEKKQKGKQVRELTEQVDNPARMLSYGVANLQGVGARERQEDSFAFVNVLDVTEIQRNGLMFIVADGMGGMKDGKLASETAIASIRESFLQMDNKENLAVQLCDSVYEADRQVFQKLEGEGGSTLIAGILFQEQLYFVSVGDSFLYLKRDGQLYHLNREHSVLQKSYLELIRAGQINLEAIQQWPEADALTQFLGMGGVDDVDVLRRPLPLFKDDILLACSDGVGGVLSQQTILSCMEMGQPDDICHSLEAEIQSQGRMNQDNYTALIIKCMY